MATAAVCGLAEPAASRPTRVWPKAALPAAVLWVDKVVRLTNTSLAPAITSTSSVPLNLPPDRLK